MNKLFKILLISIIFLSLFFTYKYIDRETDKLIIRKTSIFVPHWSKKLDNTKFIVISDIHAGSPNIDVAKLKKIVAYSNAQKPDFVLLLGDYTIKNVIGGKPIEPEIIAKELGQLKPKSKIIAVLGNHDWYNCGEKIKQELEKQKIVVLENQAIKVQNNNAAFWVGGLADLTTRYPDINKTLKSVTDNNPIIMLSHDPDLFPYIPEKVALTLAGHTHGGQIILPFIGSVITPSIFEQRFNKGHITANKRNLLVSSGIGTSILPIRVQNPPEIILLTLKSN